MRVAIGVSGAASGRDRNFERVVRVGRAIELAGHESAGACLSLA